MDTSSDALPFPVYGLTWNFYKYWVNTDLESEPVVPAMFSTWRSYVEPLAVSVFKFNLPVEAYRLGTLDDADRANNQALITRLINLCRFAESRDCRLLPVLLGAGHYRPGKENELPVKAATVLDDFLRALQVRGWLHLYERICSLAVENEMNHPTRHLLWPKKKALQLVTDTCTKLKEIEAEYTVPQTVPLTVTYAFDWLFAVNIMRRPAASVRTLLTGELYDCTVDPFLCAIATSPLVDIIGINYFPTTWARYPVETLPVLLKHVCDRFGVGSHWGKRTLVTETGYTQPLSPLHREKNQHRYYERALELLLDFYRQSGQEQGFMGLLWYCLSDTKLAPNTMPFPGELRYGVLATIPPNSYPTYPARPKLAWHFLHNSTQRRQRTP
jgi:hypothetical protein